jgi:DASS family divalent anion:Na+ symporter
MEWSPGSERSSADTSLDFRDLPSSCWFYFYIHYFFASATAHISALFPLSLALMIGAGVPAFAAAIALGVLSNVYGCLTQYGIGSGPVMYGAGYVSQTEWWRAGFIMSLVYLAIWLTVGPLWWLWLGHV